MIARAPVLLCAAWLAAFSCGGGQAQPAAADVFRPAGSTLAVRAVQQMSVVVEGRDGVLYTDPTGGASRYAASPPPDLVLVSHEHHEHFDVRTLEELARGGARLVVPPAVMEQLPETLRGNAVALANGESATFGSVSVEAIAAYGLDGAARRWHPPGRGNGYVVTLDGRRLYIAGSTQATPEMMALRDIHLAFIPLYPPYATGPEDAVRAIAAFRPDYAYIYQYDSLRTRDDFVGRMSGQDSSTRIAAPTFR